MQVLVLVHVEVVERVTIGWVTIAQSKVDGDRQLNFTAAEDILQEGVSLVEDQVLEAGSLIASTANNLVL